MYAGVCCETAEKHEVSLGPVSDPSKYMKVLKIGQKALFFVVVETLNNNDVNC